MTALIVFFVGISFPLGIEADWSFNEGKPMTMLSVFFLFAIGHFCLRIKDIVANDVNAARVWKVLGYTFIFLGFDDWLRIHETLDHTIHKIFRIKETNFTDHLDDVIVILYGVAVALILLRNVRYLLQFLPATKYFIPAAIFSAIHAVLDFIISSKPWIKTFVPDPQDLENVIIYSECVEEAFKLYAEVFIVSAIVCCYALARDRAKAVKV